jgi:hypothetical protein
LATNRAREFYDNDGFFLTEPVLPGLMYDGDTDDEGASGGKQDPIMKAKHQYWGRGARSAFFQKFKKLDKHTLPLDFPAPRPPTPPHPRALKDQAAEGKKKVPKYARPPTPRSTYLRECRKMHMPPQPMLDYYTRNRSNINHKTGRIQTSKLDSLNFNGYGMGDDRAFAFSKALQIKTALRTTTFNLASNGLKGKGAAALLNALTGMETVTSLDLSNNSIGKEGSRALVRFLLKSQFKLKFCSLKGNRLGDTLMKPVFDAVAECHTLEVFNASDNALRSAKGVAKIMTSGMNGIVELDLGWNRLRGVQVVRDIAEGLESSNCHVKSLRLAYNGFGNGTHESLLLGAMANCLSLTEIDLSFNVMSDRMTMAYLKDFFPPSNRHIKTLALDGNMIGELGARAVLGVMGEYDDATVTMTKCNITDKTKCRVAFDHAAPDGVYELNLERLSDVAVAQELLRVGRLGGPLTWKSAKVGKSKYTSSVWHDDPFWEIPKTGTLSLEFEASKTVLRDGAEANEFLRTAELTKNSCLAAIPDDKMERVWERVLNDRAVVDKRNEMDLVRYLAKDHWFTVAQAETLLGLCRDEELKIKQLFYLFPKLVDLYDSRLGESGDDVPNLVQLFSPRSKYGVSRLVALSGFSPWHQTGHYTFDLGIEEERERCKALLALDTMQSFHWKKHIVANKLNTASHAVAWGSVDPILGPTVLFRNLLACCNFTQAENEWSCVRNAEYSVPAARAPAPPPPAEKKKGGKGRKKPAPKKGAAKPAAPAPAPFQRFSREWKLPRRGVVSFDFVDTPTHAAYLRKCFPQASVEDVEKLEEMLRRAYRTLNHQELVSGFIGMEERDAFFNTRIKGLLGGWQFNLTCLQLSRLMNLVAHGEHHHEVHPSFDQQSKEAYENQFRINREHHLIESILCMFPKLTDVKNLHLPLILLSEKNRKAVRRAIGHLRLFNVMRPESEYTLSLEHSDDRALLGVLIDMCKDEGSGVAFVAKGCAWNGVPFLELPKARSPLTPGPFSPTAADCEGTVVLVLQFVERGPPHRPGTTESRGTGVSSTSARVGVKGLKQWEQDVIQREEEEKRKQKLSGKKKSPKWKRKRKLGSVALTGMQVLGGKKPSRGNTDKPPKWFNVCNSFWVGVHE